MVVFIVLVVLIIGLPVTEGIIESLPSNRRKRMRFELAKRPVEIEFLKEQIAKAKSSKRRRRLEKNLVSAEKDIKHLQEQLEEMKTKRGGELCERT